MILGTQWSLEPLDKSISLPSERRRSSIGSSLKKRMKKVATKIHQIGQPKTPLPRKRQRSSFIPPHLLEDEDFCWAENSIASIGETTNSNNSASSIDISNSNINLAFHTWRNPIPILEVGKNGVIADQLTWTFKCTQAVSTPDLNISVLSLATLSTDRTWTMDHIHVPDHQFLDRYPRKGTFPILKLPAKLVSEIVRHASVTTLVHLFHTTKMFRLVIVDMIYGKYFRKFYKQWRYPKLEDLLDIALQLKDWAMKVTPEVTESRIVGWLQMLLFHVSSYLVAMGLIPQPETRLEQLAQDMKMDVLKRWDRKIASCPTSYFKTSFQIFPRERGRLRDCGSPTTVEDIDFDFEFDKID
ncbi:hypothetical protein TWF481_000476 [Arthrobotrys musiformis]|uniref:F-box domain-containing protein n=1 Tax=Arthrobotrys musiformis TaxID=47236 RepID=A0AAV9WTF8_9PEZI